MYTDSHQLKKYPYLEKKVMELDIKGLCDYHDVLWWDNNFRDKDYINIIYSVIRPSSVWDKIFLGGEGCLEKSLIARS